MANDTISLPGEVAEEKGAVDGPDHTDDGAEVGHATEKCAVVVLPVFLRVEAREDRIDSSSDRINVAITE
jgi:hypothetical protein